MEEANDGGFFVFGPVAFGPTSAHKRNTDCVLCGRGQAQASDMASAGFNVASEVGRCCIEVREGDREPGGNLGESWLNNKMVIGPHYPVSDTRLDPSQI